MTVSIATVMATAEPSIAKYDRLNLPLQKVLEAASQSTAQQDYDRLRQLLPYFEPTIQAYRERHKDDLWAKLEDATHRNSAEDVRRLLEKIAFFDLTMQLEFPKGSDHEHRRSRLKLAYLDYYYVLLDPIEAKDIQAENRIRGWFHKAHLVPESEWPSKIIEEISRVMFAKKSTGTKR